MSGRSGLDGSEQQPHRPTRSQAPLNGGGVGGAALGPRPHARQRGPGHRRHTGGVRPQGYAPDDLNPEFVPRLVVEVKNR